jgi:alpha-L-fucosidase
MTMNDTWGFKANDHNWKSAETLVHNLIDIAAKGGNYLLNVGPTAEGLIPAPSVERLAEMGAWLRQNGEAIYATNSLKQYKEGNNVKYTVSKDGKSTYVILTANPGGSITLKQVKFPKGSRVSLLGSSEKITSKSGPDGTTFTLPASLPGKYAWVLKITRP